MHRAVFALATLLGVALAGPAARRSSGPEAAAPPCVGEESLGCAFDDTLAPETLSAVAPHVVEASKQDGTRWFPLRGVGSQGRRPRRSPLEELIGNVIAPLALGSDLHLYEGGDWWIQHRKTSTPKEYHADTDTDLCQNSGETNCTAADISSVFFFGSDGGPTVVFNQAFNEFGLRPRIPTELGLCSPRSARLLVFRGSLYHGVLHATSPGGTGLRTTLLVNWWKRRPQEPRDFDFKKDAPARDRARVPRIRMGPAARRVPKVQVAIDSPFDKNLDSWVAQRLPDSIAAEMQRRAAEQLPQPAAPAPAQAAWQRSGVFQLQMPPSRVNEQVPDTDRVPSWALWH